VSRNPALVDALKTDWRQTTLDPRLQAMLEYAINLTRTPAEVQREDIERLRKAGLDDWAILDIAQVVAYFNVVNRMADGLGVELER
jgi:uncharacterized peroxidase-related enzyme